MHASPFDFVSVLSAEEACPLCSELHATVDQCACAACGTNTCPDCASLRPDASWVCASCAVHAPGRAIVAGTRGAALFHAVRQLHLSLTELVLFRPRSIAGQPSAWACRLQTLRSRVPASFRSLRAKWLPLWAGFGLWFAGRSVRARVGLSSLAGVMRRQQRRQHALARHVAGSLLVTLRSLQWRQHASSLLIATVIMIAVARSQTSPDAR